MMGNALICTVGTPTSRLRLPAIIIGRQGEGRCLLAMRTKLVASGVGALHAVFIVVKELRCYILYG